MRSALQSMAVSTLGRYIQPVADRAMDAVPTITLSLPHATVAVHPSRLAMSLAVSSVLSSPPASPTSPQQPRTPSPVTARSDPTPLAFELVHSMHWNANRQLIHRVAIHEPNQSADDSSSLLSIETPYSAPVVAATIAFGLYPWYCVALLLLLPVMSNTNMVSFVICVSFAAIAFAMVPSQVGSTSPVQFAMRAKHITAETLTTWWMHRGGKPSTAPNLRWVQPSLVTESPKKINLSLPTIESAPESLVPGSPTKVE
ncbi:hypothetical protein BC828DRAFT_373540 [Blastocladiella britannica]|nr:hypothetical protein BC828DRAFT_373540 [Blastocladiella britannica]